MLNKFVKDLIAFLSITQMTVTAATYVGWKDQMKIRQMLTKGSIHKLFIKKKKFNAR